MNMSLRGAERRSNLGLIMCESGFILAANHALTASGQVLTATESQFISDTNRDCRVCLNPPLLAGQRQSVSFYEQ